MWCTMQPAAVNNMGLVNVQHPEREGHLVVTTWQIAEEHRSGITPRGVHRYFCGLHCRAACRADYSKEKTSRLCFQHLASIFILKRSTVTVCVINSISCSGWKQLWNCKVLQLDCHHLQCWSRKHNQTQVGIFQPTRAREPDLLLLCVPQTSSPGEESHRGISHLRWRH